MNPISGLIKRCYSGLCRIYARHIIKDKPADLIMSILCSLYFRKVHGYWPYFKNPRSLSEITWNRMLYDRNPRLTQFSDKWLVRDYVADRVGKKYLIPLLWKGGNPEEIPFNDLPPNFVIKTNHGCGYNIIVKDKTRLDLKKTKRRLRKWLAENFCEDKFLGIEWGYKHIQPTIMVESFLSDNGTAPLDYKFFCNSGRVEYYKVDFERFRDHSELFFDRNANHIKLTGKGIKAYEGKFELPNNFSDMIRVAESLAKDIDFVRVDLYSVDNQAYFGEMTCYHGGGVIKLSPRKYDFLFGKKFRPKGTLI